RYACPHRLPPPSYRLRRRRPLTEVKALSRTKGISWAIAVMEDVVAGTPLLQEAQTADGQVRLTAAGAWTAPNAAELERLVQQLTLAPSKGGAASIDMHAIERFDPYGALLLARLSHLLEGRGQPLRVIALAGRYQGLFQELHRVDPHTLEAQPRGNGKHPHLKSLDRGVSEIGRDLLVLANMLGALSLALVPILRRPMQFRLI